METNVKKDLTTSQLDAKNAASIKKQQIAIKEAEIMELCEEEGLDKNTFLNQSFSGDSPYIDYGRKYRELFTNMSGRRANKILLKELVFCVWKQARPACISDRDFTIKVCSLVRAFSSLHPEYSKLYPITKPFSDYQDLHPIISKLFPKAFRKVYRKYSTIVSYKKHIDDPQAWQKK